MSEIATIEPVRRSIMVDMPAAEAFRVFTAEMGSWWPLLSHSINGENVAQLVFEERRGGTVYELSKAGERCDWADVLAWEPPMRFVLDWHVNPEEPSTELEVRFTGEGEGTRVELEHRGWERMGERGEEARGHYDDGWATVLGAFEDKAS